MTCTETSMDALRGSGDELADAVVATLFERGEVGTFNTLMRHVSTVGQELPEGLPEVAREYLHATSTPPHWVDWTEMEKARLFFIDNNVHISTALSFAPCPPATSFRTWPSSCRPRTGWPPHHRPGAVLPDPRPRHALRRSPAAQEGVRRRPRTGRDRPLDTAARHRLLTALRRRAGRRRPPQVHRPAPQEPRVPGNRRGTPTGPAPPRRACTPHRSRHPLAGADKIGVRLIRKEDDLSPQEYACTSTSTRSARGSPP